MTIERQLDTIHKVIRQETELEDKLNTLLADERMINGITDKLDPLLDVVRTIMSIKYNVSVDILDNGPLVEWLFYMDIPFKKFARIYNIKERK